MLHSIMTGQVKGLQLLLLALALFFYFLPSVVAFSRGHRRFFVILILNVVVSPVQVMLARTLAPGLLALDPKSIASIMTILATVSFGPGWVALLVWALWPGEPDPRLLKMQETKYYDAIMALPLILWFAYGALQLRPQLARDLGAIASGNGSLFIWVQFFSLLAAAGFDLLLIYLLAVREKPVAKSKGVLPRVFGFTGTFLGVGILQLPVAKLTLPLQMLAALLIGLGSLGSLLVLSKLGKSFSIMPEARRLVTGGAYAWVRHPLYTVEIVTIAGTALQFQAPWSWVIMLAVVLLLWIRSHYEEQVLEQTYPEYGAYRSRTKRFIPGII
jgi:protein-S-isoprenylcysteine O-methyltransferase Ste14